MKTIRTAQEREAAYCDALLKLLDEHKANINTICDKAEKTAPIMAKSEKALKWCEGLLGTALVCISVAFIGMIT